MSERNASIRAYPAYWACNAILAMMAGYFITKVALAPNSSIANTLELIFLFTILAFAPGTFSLIAGAVALIFKKRPATHLRVGTYITTAFYIVAYFVMTREGSL